LDVSHCLLSMSQPLDMTTMAYLEEDPPFCRRPSQPEFPGIDPMSITLAAGIR
jgi:hypothetical protein